MLFKYQKKQGSQPIWALIDGLIEVEWTRGWAVKHITYDEDDAPEDRLGVTLKDPEEGVTRETAYCVARLNLSDGSREMLLNGKVTSIPVVIAQLKKSDNEMPLPVAVEAGYILNDDGKTVEKLMARA